MELFPPVTLERVGDDVANGMLAAWGHPLGACNRPFRQDFHGLYVHGQLVGVTTTASTVSATCAGRPRTTIVELARIARHPAEPWVLRPLLRLWRECVARSWPCWPVQAAVSYALPGYAGDIYRFDGWTKHADVKPSSGGGTWSSRPAVNDIGDGVKGLWVYDFRGDH